MCGKLKKYLGWKSILRIMVISSIMLSCSGPKHIACNSASRWMCSDSLMLELLDSLQFKLLMQPDSVKCYHLSYKDSLNEVDIPVIGNYIRDNYILRLNSSQISVLQYLLPSNLDNYQKDSLVFAQAPYMPCLEFEFIKQDSLSVSLLISTLDYSWQIVREGKTFLSFKKRFQENPCI